VRNNRDGTYSPYFSMDKVGTYNIWVWVCADLCTGPRTVIGDGTQIEFELNPGPNDFATFTAYGADPIQTPIEHVPGPVGTRLRIAPYWIGLQVRA
jgi:hypothetical protein